MDIFTTNFERYKDKCLSLVKDNIMPLVDTIMPFVEDNIKSIAGDSIKSFVGDKFNNFNDCHSEFELMKENMFRIQNFVKDIKDLNHGMKTIDHFTYEMGELMYDLEDTTADYSRMGIKDRHGIGKKLKDVNEKIRTMHDTMNEFLNLAVHNKKVVVPQRPCDPINDETKIVGLGDAIIKIKNWVLLNNHGDSKAKYNCIGLVGKGGSGKTTLAQMVHKDQEINQHFKLDQQKQNKVKRSKHSIKKVLFVTVSQHVDVKMMMKSMLKQLDDKTKDDVDEREMSAKIYEYLKGSRYFLILDDVWKLDGSWWETIKNALPEGSQNCILITSRNERNVQRMGVSEERTHVPEPLGDDDGWTLFCKNISTDDVSKDAGLKEIGMQIVKQCSGLPLAIKVMGGVVSSYHISPPQWMEIRDRFKQYISNNENDSQVMGSLELSYDDLPETHLQQCLLCLALFQEDTVIDRDTLIRWWIGEGLVPLTEKGRVSVESAEKCLEELVNRSLIDVHKRDYNWKVLECKLHDLVRDMLIRKGKSEGFFGTEKQKICRRILLNEDISYTSNQISVAKTKIRAIITPRGKNWKQDSVRKEFLDNISNKCKYLRVLDMCYTNSELKDEDMFKCVGNLKHLTYLNLSDFSDFAGISYQRSKYPRIPEFQMSLLVICLRTQNIETLPDFITELKQLIWLDVSGCSHLKYLPKGLGNVSTLQVLKGFMPSQKGCRFEELRKLTQLVTLEIKKICESELSDSELNALSELDKLRRLVISYPSVIQKLDNLVLPEKLDDLRLVRYPGEETPPWLNAEHLPRLRCLSLFDGMKLKCFHKNFYGSDQNKWGIIHLELTFLLNLQGDWNVVLEKLPYLKTLLSIDYFHIRLANYPTQEFNKEGVWRRR